MEFNPNLDDYLYYPKADKILQERDAVIMRSISQAAARGFFNLPGNTAQQINFTNEKASQELTLLNIEVANKTEQTFFERETFDKQQVIEDLNQGLEQRKADFANDKQLAEVEYNEKQQEHKRIERETARAKTNLEEITHAGKIDVLSLEVGNALPIARQESNAQYELTAAKDRTSLEIKVQGDEANTAIKVLADEANTDIKRIGDETATGIKILGDETAIDIRQMGDESNTTILQSKEDATIDIRKLGDEANTAILQSKDDLAIGIRQMGDEANTAILQSKDDLAIGIRQMGDEANTAILQSKDGAAMHIMQSKDGVDIEIRKLSDGATLDIKGKQAANRIEILGAKDQANTEIRQRQAMHTLTVDSAKLGIEMKAKGLQDASNMKEASARAKFNMGTTRKKAKLDAKKRKLQATQGWAERWKTLDTNLTIKAIEASNRRKSAFKKERAKEAVAEAREEQKRALVSQAGDAAAEAVRRRHLEAVKNDVAKIAHKKEVDAANTALMEEIARIRAQAAKDIAAARKEQGSETTSYITLNDWDGE